MKDLRLAFCTFQESNTGQLRPVLETRNVKRLFMSRRMNQKRGLMAAFLVVGENKKKKKGE